MIFSRAFSSSILSRSPVGLPGPAPPAAVGGGDRLKGKVAVVTGGASGIGRETCLAFAREGSKVIVADIAKDGADAVAAEIAAMKGCSADQVEAISLDVCCAQQWQALYEKVEKDFGHVNVVFNNAGISHADDDNCEVTDEQVWDITMQVNLKGVFLGCKYGIPALRRAGGGSIINTASFVGVLGAATPQIAYTTSKGGVIAMSRELAVIHARENIRVNALCPGPLNTELLQKYLDTEEKAQRRLVHIPLGRFGEAHEIASATVFLASDESSFVTGSSFMVDGGITAAYVTPE
mmetsp:Transcript_11087/g.16633  ORF Transcript_11087/g.16633 Transcript_11087/m.16633 type:complete len:293 (-) Transcript_11087:49-927(-)